MVLQWLRSLPACVPHRLLLIPCILPHAQCDINGTGPAYLHKRTTCQDTTCRDTTCQDTTCQDISGFSNTTLAAGTVVPLLSSIKMSATPLLRYHHIIIFQLPLCSYSGVTMISSLPARVPHRLLLVPCIQPNAQCDFRAPSEGHLTLSAQVYYLSRYTSVWIHNNKSTSSSMDLASRSMIGINTRLENHLW